MDCLPIREHHDSEHVAMTAPIGVTRLSAATPPIVSTRRISSVAYATDESGSEDSTASPVTRENRS